METIFRQSHQPDSSKQPLQRDAGLPFWLYQCLHQFYLQQNKPKNSYSQQVDQDMSDIKINNHSNTEENIRQRYMNSMA